MADEDITNQQLLDALTDQLGTITDHMITKDDLKGFATKDDIKAFATKAEVKEIVREETADIRDEQLRRGVLLEDLDDNVKKLAESVSKELKLKNKVNDHDKRVTALETKNRLVVSTATHHSAQIKALQASKH
jgi:hypothetical protein